MNIRYRYSYNTTFRYTPPVERHYFRLRYLPMSCGWQQPEISSLEVSPFVKLRNSTDFQGNEMQWGELIPTHACLIINSQGVVVQNGNYEEYGMPHPVYYQSTQLTRVDEDILDAYPELNRCGDVFATATYIMSRTHEIIDYVPGATDWRDSAMTSWHKGQGVCQDMAHIMIGLCRRLKIASRYVVGLIEGEGQTHAWVEVSDGKLWLPFDPTHNRCPETGYMKIAHGRDAFDCATVRGHFFSLTSERMEVECKLEKI